MDNETMTAEGEADELARAQASLTAMRAKPAIPAPGLLGAEIGGILGRVATRASDPAYQALVAESDRRARVAERRALASLAASIDVPADEDLRAVALDPDPAETDALRILRGVAAARTPRRGCVVVVAGQRGTGKSAAAAWVLLRVETSALWLSAPDLGACPRNTHSESEARWRRWLSVGCLVVDDLGTEMGDPESAATLLWQRYSAGLLTICTANLT